LLLELLFVETCGTEKLLKGEDSIFIVDVGDFLCSSITLLLLLVLLLLRL